MATNFLWHVAILASYVIILVTSESSKIEAPIGNNALSKIEAPIGNIAEPKKSDAKRSGMKSDAKRSGSDCYVAGHVFRDGEVFSYPGYSHCIKYRCDNGGYYIVKPACERNNRCIDLDKVVQEGCRSLRCVRERNGNSHVYYMEPTVQDQCEVNGRCIPKNRDFEHSDCLTYRCEDTPYGGYRFHVVPGSAKCKDDFGRCIRVGGRFSKRVKGRYYRNCICLHGGAYECRG